MATATDDNAEIRNLDARLFREINLLVRWIPSHLQNECADV